MYPVHRNLTSKRFLLPFFLLLLQQAFVVQVPDIVLYLLCKQLSFDLGLPIMQ